MEGESGRKAKWRADPSLPELRIKSGKQVGEKESLKKYTFYP